MGDSLKKDIGWLTQERAQILVFIAFAAAVAYLCWLLVEPMAAPVAWALSLGIVAHPLYVWLHRLLRLPSVAAAVATLLVAVMLVLPAVLAGGQVAQEAVAAAKAVQVRVEEGRWQEFVERSPRIAATIDWFDATIDLREQLGKLSEHVPQIMQKVMAGSLQFFAGAGIALFLLFFFLRDRVPMLAALRGLLPLSEAEATLLFRQVHDMIYAIVYGTLAVCVVQGALGALAFWWLGLHAPLLWGSAMALMSIVPVVGTAIIWGPAAVYLLLQGNAGSALMLAVWGFLVIGLIDNLLKPAIVKGRLRVHIVPVFISIFGGLVAFGAAGVIIGPVVLALALALIDIRRARVQSRRV